MCLDVEGLSVVYSLMYSLEYLERGLISGDVKFEDYTTECNSLLNSSKLLKQPKHYFQQFANVNLLYFTHSHYLILILL